MTKFKTIDTRPSETSVSTRLVGVKDDPIVQLQDSALSELFRITYPDNTDINHIVIKASALNTLYSTQMRKKYFFPVVEQIKRLNIDDRLQEGDLTIIDDMIATPLENGKFYRCYSFATKYCSFHKPDTFPIYDSYVDQALVQLQLQDNFSKISVLNNRDYVSYCKALSDFKLFYGLEKFSMKEIDKYLWHVGFSLTS